MNIYLVVILAVIIAAYVLDLVADLLNLRHAATDLPEEFKGYYDEKRYKKSQEYLRETTRFGILTDSIVTPVTILFILFGGFNVVDRFSRDFHLGPIPTGLIFTGVLMLASHLLHIPFSLYDTFVIEERYGFNKTTPMTFVLDILKTWVLAVLIGGAVLSAVLWFFEKTGSMAWLYCWIVVILFQVLLIFVAPVVILPLFNKFSPLEEGELKEAIEDYTGSQGFKLKGVFTMDGSKRSTRSNAFFTGLGRFRRIVLFDTLIRKHTVTELISVLAHEMGHYKKRHVLISFLISIVTTGVTFFILSLFMKNEALFRAFKMEEASIYASLIFFGFLYSPGEMVLGFFTNFLSRRHEYEADAYAVRTYKNPDALIAALKKLNVDNLANLTPHPLKVILNHSHPPVLERIQAIGRLGS